MAITAIGQFCWPVPFAGTASALTSFTLNAAGDKLGFVVQVPKTGTLDWFEFLLGTVSNNPDNGLRLSFQDIDLTTGFPDGVVDQFFNEPGAFSSNTWVTPTQVLTDTGAGGGAKRSVTAGQWLGCVVDFVTFVAGDSIDINALNSGITNDPDNFYVASGVTGSYAKSTTAPILTLKYSDSTYGEFPLKISPYTAINSHTFNSGSTPDERALKFQVPVGMRAMGAWVRLDADGPGSVILYDSGGSTLATGTFDPDARGQTGSGVTYVYFDTPVTLSAATDYRLSLLPSSVTSVIGYSFTVPSAGLMAAVNGGSNLIGSTRTDAGAWTDSSTTRPIMGLIINGIDVSASGGAHSGAYFG